MNTKHICLILVSIALLCRCTLDTSQDEVISTFGKPFPSYGEGRRIQESKNGGYLIAGTTITGSSSTVYLVKVDSRGEITNFKTYNTGYYDRAESMIELSDQTIAIVGSRYNNTTKNSDLLYLRIDPSNFNILNDLSRQSISLSSTEAEIAKSVKQVGTNNILIVGYTTNAGNSDVYVVKLNFAGDTFEFNKKINGSDQEFALDVVETSSGYFIVGNIRTSSPNQTDAMIMQIDLNTGNPKSGFPKRLGGSSSSDIFYSVTLSGNQLYMAGVSDAAGDNDVYLLKTDLDGNPSTGFPKSFRVAGTQEAVYEIRESNLNELLMVGSKDDDVYFLVVTADEGKATLEKPYVATGNQTFNSGLKSKDGGFIFTGAQEQFLYVIKTDKSGYFSN